MYLISHCVTESKLAKGNITRRIESDNHVVGISSLYRYTVASVPFYIKLPICYSTNYLMYHNLLSKLNRHRIMLYNKYNFQASWFYFENCLIFRGKMLLYVTKAMNYLNFFTIDFNIVSWFEL